MKKELIFDQPILVTQPILPPLENYVEYLEEIWNRNWLTNNGPVHEKFKGKVKEYLNVDNVELFTNGHTALEIAIKALDLTGEVITTPFTFASTTHAIVNCGLTPVFCEVDPVNYNIDVNEIEKHITKNTSAILAVHVFGIPCDVEKIQEIADKHDLMVIYDAAHALGVKKDGIDIGRFGDISMFSLHATKVMHTIEGGILTYNNDTLSEKLDALKNFGITKSGTVDYIGTNAKMNEIQAAMGLCNMEILDGELEKRKSVYNIYLQGLKNVDNIVFIQESSETQWNYAYFPILLGSLEQRDQLFEKLQKYNVFSRKYFYPLISDFGCYDFDSKKTPVAYDISERVLCLPMYSTIDLTDVKQITEIIAYELGENVE